MCGKELFRSLHQPPSPTNLDKLSQCCLRFAVSDRFKFTFFLNKYRMTEVLHAEHFLEPLPMHSYNSPTPRDRLSVWCYTKCKTLTPTILRPVLRNTLWKYKFILSVNKLATYLGLIVAALNQYNTRANVQSRLHTSTQVDKPILRTSLFRPSVWPLI